MRIFFFFSFLFFSVECFSSIYHISSSHEVFRSYEWIRADHPIATGPLMHHEDDLDCCSNEYYMSSNLFYSGLHRRFINDYHSMYSAEYLNKAIGYSLARQGYHSIFECSSLECGPADAFQALLDPLVFSPEDLYFYQVFVRNNDYSEIVTVYTVLIDSQVRVLFDIYSRGDVEFFIDLRLDSQRSHDVGVFLYFDLNEYSVGLVTGNRINDFIRLRSALGEQVYLNVYAHADHAGDHAINRRISDLRLLNIMEYLAQYDFVTVCEGRSFSDQGGYFPSRGSHPSFSDRKVNITVADPC